MNALVSPMTQKDQIAIKPFTRKVAEVAGLMSQYKKAKTVTIEVMDQAILHNINL